MQQLSTPREAPSFCHGQKQGYRGWSIAHSAYAQRQYRNEMSCNITTF